MSRKHNKNRDMLKDVKIGIFKGKKAKYNIAILEVLLFAEEPPTSWGVAKLIQKRQEKRGPIDKDKAFVRKHGIYSVIQRKKGGRLSELEKKGYVELENEKWVLTFKGLMAILIKNPALGVKLPCYLKASKIQFDFPDKMEVPILKWSIDGKKMRAFVEALIKEWYKPKVFVAMAEWVKKFIQEGMADLDGIEEDTLMQLVLIVMSKNKEFQDVVKRNFIGS